MTTVTVKKKTPDHLFVGKGAQYAFVIGDIENSVIHVKRGETYDFMINSPGHPFYFTKSDVGGPQDISGTLMNGLKPQDNGPLDWTVPMNAPVEFYYQCRDNQMMGGKVIVDN
jgi:hypothetical protein